MRQAFALPLNETSAANKPQTPDAGDISVRRETASADAKSASSSRLSGQALLHPMTFSEVPLAVVFLPARRFVAIAVTLGHPMTLTPDVTVIGVVPIARRPDVARARRRHHLRARWRRCQIDVDVDA